MRSRLYLFSMLLALALPAVAEEAKKPAAPNAPAVPAPASGRKRFIVVRSFPAGVIDGVDAAAKKQINATNASFNVKWVESFANADKTRTYCVYDGPSEQAVRDAAKANKISVDDITEVPVVLLPQ